MNPEVLLHAGLGALGLLTGATAALSRKGERLHRTAGATFLLSMGATAATGAYLGVVTGEPGNTVAGVVTLYLLATGWMTVRRSEGKIGVFEVAAFLFAAAAAIAGIYVAVEAVRSGSALMGGLPYAIIASIVTLAAVADLSVLLRRGLSGRQRIARHLWRVLLGFAAAVGSFFPGQLQLFPAYIQEIRPTVLLFIPFFTVIGFLVFWLLYALLTQRFADKAAQSR
jgi:uncharacterized membrane protein